MNLRKKKLFFPLLFIIAVSAIFYSFSGSDEWWIKTELYFGLSIPGGGNLTNEEFRAFTDSVIAYAFPEGFTVVNAAGGWYDPEIKQTITEDSRIVIHYSKMDDVTSAAIDTVRAKYMRYYKQQSVLRVDQNVRAGF